MVLPLRYRLPAHAHGLGRSSIALALQQVLDGIRLLDGKLSGFVALDIITPHPYLILIYPICNLSL
jgi:hypothetical protein